MLYSANACRDHTTLHHTSLHGCCLFAHAFVQVDRKELLAGLRGSDSLLKKHFPKHFTEVQTYLGLLPPFALLPHPNLS